MTPPGLVLDAIGLSKSFDIGTGLWRRPRRVQAVSHVSLQVFAGDIVGVSGASGSGKSTLARLLARLLQPDEGRLLHRGRDVLAMDGRDLRTWRKQVQCLPQNAYVSLDPAKSVGQAIRGVARLHQPARSASAVLDECLEQVGLPPSLATRRPRTLSGGQRQRVALARVLAVGAGLLICDEPTSALDAIATSEIAQLLVMLNQVLGTTIIIISHDRKLLEKVSTRTFDMVDGRISETSMRGV